jgi:hypothetical protein
MLALGSVIAGSQSQPRDQANESNILRAVGLLFHGSYGEGSYAVSEESNGSLTLENLDAPLRINVRRVTGEACTFIATHQIASGKVIEALNLTKFDGKHDLREGCGPAGTILATQCTDSLYFGTPEGYCQAMFPDAPLDLDRVQFPDRACRPFIIGFRRRQFLSKYIEAFETAYAQCGERR